MSNEEKQDVPIMIVKSSRFGDLEVPEGCEIEFPVGIIGFPRHQKFVMLDHKPPFSWLHSTQDPNLAFVVVDGFEFGAEYELRPPIGDKETDLQEEDEYAILVIVTVRPDPTQTTANLKAPLFVNLRNRKGVQVIYDNPELSTRYPLFAQGEGGEAEQDGDEGQGADEGDLEPSK